MRPILLLLFISLFCYVYSKNVKTLNEPIGQEVIEIAGPKELPPGLEEEPSGDMDDDDEQKASKTSTVKKDKKAPSVDARKKLKDVEKIDGLSTEDEEARLEKELSEIYKDNDYKDSGEDTSETKRKSTTSGTSAVPEYTSADDEKPIGRQRNNFKFAPDSTNKQDVDRFRTSMDDISCKDPSKGHTTPVVKDPELTLKPEKGEKQKGSSQRLMAASLLQMSLPLITKLWI